MATNNAVNTPLQGTTGTGNFVGANAPTLITPILGAATATTLAFNPTTGGIIGTTAADNAVAGRVGELLGGTFANAVAMVSGATTQIQTLSLSAGDWDVWAVFFTTVGAGTVSGPVIAGLATTTASLPAPSSAQTASLIGSNSQSIASQQFFGNTGQSRWNVSGATTVFLNANASYSVSTLTGNGAIFARRRR